MIIFSPRLNVSEDKGGRFKESSTVLSLELAARAMVWAAAEKVEKQLICLVLGLLRGVLWRTAGIRADSSGLGGQQRLSVRQGAVARGGLQFSAMQFHWNQKISREQVNCWYLWDEKMGTFFSVLDKTILFWQRENNRFSENCLGNSKTWFCQNHSFLCEIVAFN